MSGGGQRQPEPAPFSIESHCGFHVHFVHVQQDPNHCRSSSRMGWPGSFVEMVKLIPLLTDPAAQAEGGRRLRCDRPLFTGLWILWTVLRSGG